MNKYKAYQKCKMKGSERMVDGSYGLWETSEEQVRIFLKYIMDRNAAVFC